MKKKLRVVFIALCALICLNSLAGCNYLPYIDKWLDSLGNRKSPSEKYMIEYMDSVETECSQYRIIDDKEEGSERIDGIETPADLTIHDKEVHLETVYTENDEFDYNLVKLDGKEIKFTADYFIANSAAFSKIVKIWDDYEDGEYKVDVDKIFIGCFFVYDGELFVSASRIISRKLKDWTACIPWTYFCFDVSDCSIKYVGYSKEMNGIDYITKN